MLTMKTKIKNKGGREYPNAKTIEALKRSDEDEKAGRVIRFKSVEEVIKYNNNLINDNEVNRD